MQKYKIKLWHEQDDEMLKQAVSLYGKKWLKVAEVLQNNRNASQCSQRWKRITKAKTQSRWTQSEDQVLLDLRLNEKMEWNEIQEFLPGRNHKQIRERFMNKLRPNIDQSPFTEEEDLIIWQHTEQFGRKWTEIEKLLKGRSQNMIKNRYHSHIRQFYGNSQNPYYIRFNSQSTSQTANGQQSIDEFDQYFDL